VTASPQIDGRIDWSSTKAALIAAQKGPLPNGCIAPTTDAGLQEWNSVAGAWLPAGTMGGYGPTTTNFVRWKPVSMNQAITFTAVITAANNATLTGNWGGNTGLYPMILSGNQAVYAYLTNGATTCTFWPSPTPSSGGSYGPALTVASATVNATVSGQAPLLAVANAYSVSASVSSGVAAVLGGAQTTAGVGTPDVPRNVVGAWTGTAVVTVVGFDVYGNPMTEASGSGTSLTGKKAFNTITSITPSANITAATFGTGSALGLPVCVNSGDFFDSRVNDVADAGTLVIADLTLPATSTTGDSRGTYTTSTALTGAKFVSAIIKPRDPATQVFTLGVTPA
jgi:hypothetical protein